MKWESLAWLDARYEVSSAGEVRSWCNSNGGRAATPRVLKQHIPRNGYAQVRLPQNGAFKWFTIHRLVLRAFTGVFGEQGNHKNGDKLDNRRVNLEWCTMSENMKHSFRVLGRPAPRPLLGQSNIKLCKPVQQLTLEGVVVKEWPSLAAARKAGFGASEISAVCRGLRPKHENFVWQYLN